MNYQVMLACNNRNGLHAGTFDAMRIHTGADVIVTIDTPPTVTREHWASGRIATVRIGRFVFTCLGYAHHVGNLAWNNYTLPGTPAFHRLLDSLEARGVRPDSVTVPSKLGVDPDLSTWRELVRLVVKTKAVPA